MAFARSLSRNEEDYLWMRLILNKSHFQVMLSGFPSEEGRGRDLSLGKYLSI